MTFHAPSTPQEHLSLCKPLPAESKVEEFVAGKGVVTRWERIRKQNHWLDAVYNACVAGHGVGIKLVAEQAPAPPPPPAPRRAENVYLAGRPDWFGRGRGGGGWLDRYKGKW
ncbi:MAG TPA: hypothetical protein VEA69_17235 [Tepidisphaeraceae bacterium]|nr:hypothetical protein [Tepidisphaeraceae bacterium]